MEKHRKYCPGFPTDQFIVLSAVFGPLLGLFSLVSSLPLLQGQMQLCYFQALITNHTLSTWASLDPSLSSYCFEADLIYAQENCGRSQIRDIRALQDCTWLLLPCNSRGTEPQDVMEVERNWTEYREEVSFLIIIIWIRLSVEKTAIPVLCSYTAS